MRVEARGFTLIELVAFMVVVSVALVALMRVYTLAAQNNVDPVVQMRALECAQAKLDEILARKFDENTPTGGVPACGSGEPGATACAGISPDAGLDDVGDYHNQLDTTKASCRITVQVIEAGAALGLGNTLARRIDVNATSDGGGAARLSAYKVNF